MPSLEVLLIAPLVIWLAYFIFGMAGFGSTVIAVPLLAHVLPMKFVIPVVVVLDCLSALRMGFKLRADVWKAEFIPLLPFLLVGLILGAIVLVKLPTQALLLLLGCLVLVLGMRFLLQRPSSLRLPRWAAVPFGVFAGTTSSALGVGGPIYVFYFTARGATPPQVRATVPAVFSFTTVARIAIFAGIGLFNTRVLLAVAALLPVTVFATWCGHQAHGRLTRENALRVVGSILLLSGLSLLMRAVAD
jgi:hypothetical protein